MSTPKSSDALPLSVFALLVSIGIYAILLFWNAMVEKRCADECHENGLVFFDVSTREGCRCLPPDAIRTLDPEPMR